MVGVFRQKNPGNNLILLAYGLVLKTGVILHSPGALRLAEDHYLYGLLLQLLEWLRLPSLVYGILAFLMLYVQAVLLNRIMNDQKMLGRANYLPGMALMLISSLFEEWNQFSAPLIINTLVVVIFYRMVKLYNSHRAMSDIFNIGMLVGIVSLLYQPAIVFLLMLYFALFIMRPFRIREWLIALVGVSIPYYFLALEPLFTGNWNWKFLLPSVVLDFPAMPASVFITISIGLLVFPFIAGGFLVQANLSKMLIHTRKDWSLLLLFLILSLAIILVNGGVNYVNWSFCLMPLAAFHAAVYFYPGRRLFPLILHWVTFLYAAYILYF